MAVTASVSLTVPALPDNDVWFINAAAWSAYWNAISADVFFVAAATTTYTDSPYNLALAPINMNINGVDNIIPTLAMFQSLLDDYNALKVSYKDLRQQLFDAGYIDTV